MYIGLVDGKPAGTIVLQWSDLFWWGETPPDAGYVHKFAIRPVYAGQGVGLEMLKWAEAKTMAAGRVRLRLNSIASDRGIRDYYEKAGFVHLGDVRGSLAIASLYEKRL